MCGLVGVVELPDARRLGSSRELVEKRRARERPVGELREGPLARLVVDRPAQDLAEHALDEGLVRRLVRIQRGCDPAVHDYV